MQRIFICLLVLIVYSQNGSTQKFWFKKKKPPIVVAFQDTIKKEKVDLYKKVITSEAVTDSGFFITHKVKDQYYFELPNSILEKEILITSRISGFVKNLNFGGAGVESRPQRVIRWQKRENQILMRYVSYNSIANETDPIYLSVKNNNFEPIVMVFDIKTYNADSSAFVIDVAPLFTQDVDLIGPMSEDETKKFAIRGVDSKRSFIESMKSFPHNVEVRHVLTFNGNKLPDNQLAGAMSLEMNQSFVLLPEVPMRPRIFDQRVGYFSVSHTNYSLDAQRAAEEKFITRWRLEIKPEDSLAYFRGELVEPMKPIVYYIDPATPEKWRNYIKLGIEDWQVAFEAAGFKNAITARDAPTKEEDPDWSPEDVRYSVVRYVSTDIENAMGPHVHDPRTGEILESDIIWYHNVMNLLRNWYFIQTAAVNADARKIKLDDEVMGQLIRFACSHEVGHTLGLPHNMGSSSAYAVDSLRSPSFTAENGISPSIMDYARFNYVAQSNDGKVDLVPKIGAYDKWSIQFGYKVFVGSKNAQQDKDILDVLIKEKAANKMYRFGRQRLAPVDPSAQTEDLGDNSMLASDLGINNLKIIVNNLEAWATKDGENYDDLSELYNQVIGQYRKYIGHVVANIGGIYENYKTSDQEGDVYEFVQIDRQKEAVEFIKNQVFKTPTWLINKNIIGKIEESSVAERIRSIQDITLALIINQDRLKRLLENTALNGEKAYSVFDLFDDLTNAIYAEVHENKSIDIYRRNLQRTYLEGLQRVMESESNQFEHTDMKAAARFQLMKIQKLLLASRIKDAHIVDLIERIKGILEYKEK